VSATWDAGDVVETEISVTDALPGMSRQGSSSRSSLFAARQLPLSSFVVRRR